LYLKSLTNFATCPNQTNFDTLNVFYNNYFQEQQEKIINSAIGNNDEDEDECLINHQPAPCALEPTFGWLNPFNSLIGVILYGLY